jgi:hypothetical protein
MPELHDLLERRATGYAPPSDLLDRVRERGRRRERTRRVATAVLALVVTAISVGGLARLLPGSTVVSVRAPDLLAGTWGSTDMDGSSQTMDIRALDGGTYEVVVYDDAASICSGAPSTMRGTGRLDDTGLVVPTPMLECDDGSTPVPLDGSSLEEALRDYRLVHDAAADTLTDSMGIQWQWSLANPGAGATEAATSGRMWPQSSIDEVREAQRQADAGDPAYSWQVDPALDGDQSPGDAEIFSRFLTDMLGWEEFRWGAGPLSYEEGFGRSYDVVFVRCAAGQSNPLYPDDPEGGRCAPTLDEFTYETVKVGVYQPLDTGPDGIWVVRSWQPQPSLRQAVPPSDAVVAELVDAFLQARVDGQGAQASLRAAEDVPLLYATSSGVRYERFDYEVGLEWPTGRVDVDVRLFGQGGAIVVDQPFVLVRGALEYLRGETTENGAPAPEAYSLLGGRVTFDAALPWQENDFLLPFGGTRSSSTRTDRTTDSRSW